MDTGERIDVVQRVYSALLGRYHDEEAFVPYILDEYGADASSDADVGYYVLERVRSLDNAKLLALHRYLNPGETDPTQPPDDGDAPGPWAENHLRVFVSHTTAEKALAGGLRKHLARWNIDCFVAHTDIEPTKKWQDEIEAALRTCHVLVALLTEEFPKSRWCDQEVGVCVGRGILIIPVRLGIDPYGFIGNVQGLTFSYPVSVFDHPRFADYVFELLAKHPLTQAQMTEAVVARLADSYSWDNTRFVFPLFRALPTTAWTEERLARIRRAIDENVEVRDGFLLDGKGTPVPQAIEEHLRALGIGAS